MHAATCDVEMGLVREEDPASSQRSNLSAPERPSSWLARFQHALRSGNALPAVLFAIALASCSIAVVLIRITWQYSNAWRVPAYLASVSAHHLLEACVSARHRSGGPLFGSWQQQQQHHNHLDADEWLPPPPIRRFLSSWNDNNWPIYAVSCVECIVRYSGGRMWYIVFLEIPPLTHIGVCLMLTGNLVRALALLHASSTIAGQQQQHQADNKAVGTETHPLLLLDKDKPARPILMTTGVYGILRHPAYLGVLLWTVGSQLVVCPGVLFPCFSFSSWPIICFTWAHLVGRIRKEERWLERTFGQAYLDYKGRSWTLIPFA